MSQEKTEAIVVRGVDYSETSRVVTFLTPGRGRVACLAKGARRKNSRLAPVLDTFNRVELVYVWKANRSVQILTEATLIEGFPALKRDLERVVYGAFPLELAVKVAYENEPSQALYADLILGFENLARWMGDAKAHVCWQVFRLLIAAGFEPALKHCTRCGRDTATPAGFAYDGGVTCTQCRADRRLSVQGYAALCALQSAGSTCPAVEAAGEVFQVLRYYAERQIETSFRSARVIEDMFG